MTRDEARAILEAHNKWRRGDDTIPNDPPWALGRAIDVAVAELAKPAAVPDTCRQKLKKEGKPYPRSSCNFCGQLSPRWRDCDAMLYASPHPPAPAVSPVDVEAVRDDLERLIQHAAEVMSAVRRDDIDFANDSFRSLPDHLAQEIDTLAESISDEQYQLARAIGDET